jgi:enamine deaminase RidA (YjgF/YER057c/UK114 family)
MNQVGLVEHLEPADRVPNPAFTNVIAVSGPVKTVYVGGQDAVDASGAVVGKGDIAAQSEQIYRNIEGALAAADARPEHIIKLNILIVSGQPLLPGYEAFQRWWGQRKPPVITAAFVAGLAHPDFLVEIDAIAVVPSS